MLLNILLALVGISILVFVHELGHYLAAKRVGVRVERFAVGFDPPVRGRNLRLFSFKRGDTEYVLGAVPFGGYVKLAGGEMLLDTSHTPAADELPGKSVGARSLVFVAGSVMNIIFAFACFMLAFTLGVPFPAPVIGDVIPGSPGWNAGLLPGDRVTAIDGNAITDFSEVRLAIALGRSNQSLQFTVDRPVPQGGTESKTFSLTPRWDPDHGLNVISVGESLSPVVSAASAGDSLAARAGLKEGDEIVGFQVGDKRLPPVHFSILADAINAFIRYRPGMPLAAIVRRNGTEQSILLEPRKDPAQPPGVELGIQAAGGALIRELHPATTARKVLRTGDRIVAVNGEELPSLYWLEVFERFDSAAALRLRLAAGDGSLREETATAGELLTWILNDEIRWDDHRARVGEIAATAALAGAGMRAGDVITHVNGAPVFSPEDLQKEVRSLGADTARLRVLRSGIPEEITFKTIELRDAHGVTWDTMPEVQAVISGSPADLAGVTSGSRLLRLGTQRLYAWKEINEALQKLKPGTSTEISWRTPAGEERQANVTLKRDLYEGLRFNRAEVLVKVSPLESFAAGAKRTWISAKQIFLTLRSLIRRDVSPKNLSGPLGITHLLTMVAERESWSLLIYWLGLISINLGLFNLLPFPILDGGHLTFLAIEKIKGSPVNVRVQEWAMNVALLAILSLAVFVTFNDLKRLLP